MTTKQMNGIMTGTLKTIPLKDLRPDPQQPRQEFLTGDLNQLSESIDSKGILTPITVEPKTSGKYLIVDGERRWRAAKKLGMRSVPVNVLKNRLSATERDVARFHLQENHKHWSFFEKAEAMLRLQKSLGIETNIELAKSLGISPSTAKHYIATLDFPKRQRLLAMEWGIPFSVVVGLSHMQSIMPGSMLKKFPNFIEICLKKYKQGTIKNDKDLRVINRLVKAGEYRVVSKFFTDKNYTAIQAEMDSSYLGERHVNSIVNRANSLYRDISIMINNNLEVDEVARTVLAKLAESLESYK